MSKNCTVEVFPSFCSLVGLTIPEISDSFQSHAGTSYLRSLAHSGAVLGPLEVDHSKLITVCVVHTVETDTRESVTVSELESCTSSCVLT